MALEHHPIFGQLLPFPGERPRPRELPQPFFRFVKAAIYFIYELLT
jgi:hypothetical protein